MRSRHSSALMLGLAQRNKSIRRRWIFPLCCSALILGSIDSSAAPQPDGIEVPASPGSELEMLRTISVAPLNPDQASKEQHIGKRVRWAGGVQRIEESESGVCLILLYMLSGDDGGPRWTDGRTNQTFKACTAGSYDPELVHEYGDVTIIGTISGKAHIGMGGGSSAGPIVEIEKLYRWSDCLSGDTSPVCRAGFLDPADCQPLNASGEGAISARSQSVTCGTQRRR